MTDLREDILIFLERRGDRGAKRSAIINEVGTRLIEKWLEDVVHRIIDILDKLIEEDLIRKSRDDTDPVYMLARYPERHDVGGGSS